MVQFVRRKSNHKLAMFDVTPVGRPEEQCEEEDLQAPPGSLADHLHTTSTQAEEGKSALPPALSLHFHPSPALAAKFLCNRNNQHAAEKYSGLCAAAASQWGSQNCLGKGAYGKVRHQGALHKPGLAQGMVSN